VIANCVSRNAQLGSDGALPDADLG